MNWTKEQKQAIDLKNKNILVAAAAGSGKTAVLVERIKSLVLEEHSRIDKMLIVTFTNAAASEMKGKIEDALREAINEDHENDFLKMQLTLLPQAQISTFHSFALDVIRRFFYLINVEPNFKILDEAQKTLMEEDSVSELLEEYYSENSPEFYAYLKKYSGDRDDKRIRESILNSYRIIEALPDPFVWLENAAEDLNIDIEGFKDSKVYRYILDHTANTIDESISSLSSELEYYELEKCDGPAEILAGDLEVLEILKEASDKRDFNLMSSALSTFAFPRLSSKKAGEFAERIKANREVLKKKINSLKSNFYNFSIEDIVSEMNSTYDDAKYLVDMIERYDSIFKGKKKEKGMVDFSDIEHYALEILNDPQAADFYRNKFDHIFIDEYQDSNVIQEELISKIKRDNNLFMVGDVKQSIYKFRLAEPEIFERRYREYKTGDELSEKIDLNKNFRSKAPVIQYINRIFYEIMPGYDSDAALYPGDPYADKSSLAPTFYLVNSKWENEQDLDDELKAIRKAEKEALGAVKIINDYLGKPFFDSKLGKERPLEKKDIVILMRGIKTYGEVFYKVLTENNIPAYVDDNDGFFDTIEINTVLSMLSLLDNEKQDIPLITVMHSELGKFTTRELVEIRVADKTSSYYNALVSYSNSDDPQNIFLRDKCKAFIEDIRKWQALSTILPLNELVWKIILETGFYISMGAIPGGMQRQANLRALVDKARVYEGSQNGSLYGFIKYVDAIKKKKVSMGQVKLIGEDDDTVRIMTIHKSKGLEFPMVILAGFNKKLNYDTLGKEIGIHKDVGLAFPIVNYEESWYRSSFLQNAIKVKSKEEAVSEEKRILYVALTRAKDILAILGSSDDSKAEIEAIRESLPSDSTYFTMAGKFVCSKENNVKIINDAELSRLALSVRRAKRNEAGLIDEISSPASEEVKRLLEFKYPDNTGLSIKSKYSVSELNSHDEDSEISLTEPASFEHSGSFSASQIGTITHGVLEKMSFSTMRETGISYFDSLFDYLISRELYTKDELDQVDKPSLCSFADSELGERIASAERNNLLFREQSFNLVHKVEEIPTMVQGIIDCFFIEDGELVLIDYKNTSVKNDSVLKERYQMQIDLYREALEKGKGMRVKEAYLYLTNQNRIISM